MPPQQQAAQPLPPQIDFGKYSSAPSIDFSKYASGSSIPDTDTYWNNLKDKYDLPHSVDLSKTLFENFGKLSTEDYNKIDIDKYSKAYQEANPEAPTPTSFLGRSWDEAKKVIGGMFGESAIVGDPTKTASVAGSTPINPLGTIETVKQRAKEAVEHPAAALGAATTDVAAMAIPLLAEKAPELYKSTIGKAGVNVENALGRTLTAEEAATPRAGSENLPALANTPKDVLQYAKQKGINLTPGQATESPIAQQLQEAGRTAAVGGSNLASSLDAERSKFANVVNDFKQRVDPQAQGLSSEQAGQSVQQQVKTAREVTHDNATQNYQKINYLMDAPVDGSPISNAWTKIRGDLPMGAEDSILAQTPRSMRAVVSDLLSGNPEGFKPTVSETIQLRKFFRDLGDTEGLPDKTQATYQKMQNAASSALDSTAAKNNATDDWQAANAGWKDYQQKYGDRNSPLYKIINQRDPTKITNMLTNAPATDIELLKNETAIKDAQGNIVSDGLNPVRRQVIKDIQNSRFNIGNDDGIGGYSHAYLNTLFSPEQLKELYLQGDLARRLNYNPNSSGSGSNIAAVGQLTALNQTKLAAAAKLSMPRDPLSFLPTGTTSIPGRGSLPQSIPLAPPQHPPLAATGTNGPQPSASGPQRPLYGGRYTPEQVAAATKYGVQQTSLAKINSEIAAETDPVNKARLQRMKQTMLEENQ
jgi:hypothetical protein